jgi:hypothetical protein
MKTKKLAILLFTAALPFTLLSSASFASGTYTQGWDSSANYSQLRIVTATSTATWASIPSGLPGGPATRMNFEPISGTQTVRFSLSATLNGAAVDLTGMTCLFRSDANTTSTTSTNGSSLVTISSSSTTVVCDLTFAAGASVFGFELNDGVEQEGFIWVGRESGVVTQQSSATPTPAKYAGPEFSGLSVKGIMVGSSSRLEGKNLDEISSIEIGGKAATFTLDGDKALDLTLPSGLAPGLYDLVINSSAGKLTHINAIQVREPRRAFSITTRSEGRISEDQYQEHAIISSMQIPELNKARCMVNGSNLSQAKAQAERLCALVAAANPNIETTVVEARSTVKNSTVYARVTYGWN